MPNSQSISLNDSFVQQKGNVVSDMDGETVMLNIQRGKYYNLGEVGGIIWKLMEQPVSGQHIVAHLLSEYEVEDRECERQVMTFIEHVLEEGLISVQ